MLGLVHAADFQALEKTNAPWWHTYTPLASARLGAPDLATIQPGAARGAGIYGWYGFWYFDEVEKNRVYAATRAKFEQAGVKRVIYYDLGEVGDYAAFFTADGRLAHSGWSLPWWDGKTPLTARWFGLAAFMGDVPWAPQPTAKTYGLPAFTQPGGKPAEDLYATLTRRALDGSWKYDFSSNAKITDDFATRSGLAQLSARQTGRAEVQGKSGWQTVRLVDVDFANPQLRDYVGREIGRIIPKLRPDGIHADNFGDNNLGYANQSAFGLWSVATFRDYLRRHFSTGELNRMGVDDPAAFDITAYIREKPFASRGKAWHAMNPQWTTDPVWCCYRLHLVESALTYHRAFYAAAKKAARECALDCAIFGNTIPFPLGETLMKGSCDVAHFEWSTVQTWYGMRAMGLPPQGRVAYVTRLGAAISDAPFCWPSLYVSKDKAGAGHENLHKILACDGLVNRGLLDYGHWYLDGYSPGTPESAGFINRFIKTNTPRLGQRRYLADVALVHSAWSEIASCSVFNPVMDQFVDEYCGWCQFLGDTHRQWDVVLQQDLTATNLARFPVVVLPSVLSLSDAELGELRRYAATGGKLVTTGQTATRYGPERFLFPRTTPVEITGARSITNKPGVTYWRKERDAAAAQQMDSLLASAQVEARLKTDAPATVGVNLNFGTDAAGPLLTLDLNNYDIAVESDAIRAAPSCVTTVRLPDAWRGHDVRASVVCPEKPEAALAAKALTLDREHGTLRIQTPPFETVLIIFIREKPENAAGVQAVLAHIQKGFPQSIKADKNGDADVVGLPHPYTSPCVKEGFQQQFYWDTYFINQGLLRIGLAEQARNNVNNLLLLTDQFGIVPSANRRSMANRSQTPFLSQMVRDVYQDKPDAVWLKSAVAVLKKDYHFWMTKRLAPCGLNRSGNDATEQYLMAFYYYLAKERFKGLALATKAEQLAFSSQALSEAETWDFTPRYDRRAEEFCPLDLNSNLYIYELNFAWFSKILGDGEEAAWMAKAERRKALMQELLWNARLGCFCDYDWKNRNQADLVSCATLYPLIAGLATPQQAEQVAKAMRAKLEGAHGLATCEERTHPFSYQWDFPNAWPPLQMLAIQGLDRYGFKADAQRLARKYVDTVVRNFVKTGDLWEKYNAVTGTIEVKDEYQMPRMMGWTAGVFVYAADYLKLRNTGGERKP